MKHEERNQSIDHQIGQLNPFHQQKLSSSIQTSLKKNQKGQLGYTKPHPHTTILDDEEEEDLSSESDISSSSTVNSGIAGSKDSNVYYSDELFKIPKKNITKSVELSSKREEYDKFCYAVKQSENSVRRQRQFVLSEIELTESTVMVEANPVRGGGRAVYIAKKNR